LVTLSLQFRLQIQQVILEVMFEGSHIGFATFSLGCLPKSK